MNNTQYVTPKASAYCPECHRWPQQERTRNNGERLCSDGHIFTLKQSCEAEKRDYPEHTTDTQESIERFDLVYDRAFDGTMENPHIGPWVTGSFIRLSDHERILHIVKELEAQRHPCNNCGHADLHNGPAGTVDDACTHAGCNCGYYTPAPSLSDAIKEVEKMRDEWNQEAWRANRMFSDKANTANKIVERLKSLGPQK